MGGLGPIATAYFYELVVKMTDAKTDQEHLEMVVFSNPSIPDRTDFILGKSKESPVIPMINIGKSLLIHEVDYIAIPCITAHYFHEELEKGIHIPIIHIIKETTLHLLKYGVKKVGLMATEGTIYSKIFQDELNSQGIDCIIPSEEGQKCVTHLIYNNVKANKPVEMDKFNSVSDELKAKGAEVIILGCTELSLIKRDNPIGAGYLDAMEVLAMRSVSVCEAKLKDEYHCLITK